MTFLAGVIFGVWIGVLFALLVRLAVALYKPEKPRPPRVPVVYPDDD